LLIYGALNARRMHFIGNDLTVRENILEKSECHIFSENRDKVQNRTLLMNNILITQTGAKMR
jgi:hypothetical protein